MKVMIFVFIKFHLAEYRDNVHINSSDQFVQLMTGD